jgi:hypothetical protein
MKTHIAVTPLRDTQQQSQPSCTPPEATALLLIDPHSNRFELIQVNNELSDADMLSQISRIATHGLFRSQRYVGIIGASQVRVALPHGMTKRACLRWARSILTTDPVRIMVSPVHVYVGFVWVAENNCLRVKGMVISRDSHSILLHHDIHLLL